MDLILIPTPRTVVSEAGACQLPISTIRVSAAPSNDTLFAADQLQAAMEYSLGTRPSIVAHSPKGGSVRMLVDASGLPAQAYVVSIQEDGVLLRGGDEAGLFYAVQTFIQIIRQSEGATLPLLHIEDAPDFADRGVMLDISRDKVPTLQTVFNLVDILSEWKINQFQLYTEHTFAYSQHSDVWANASPFTPEEILRLDAYCRRRHVQLVPNQNSFGHMERWLRLPRYIDLAEAPDGSETPWGFRWQGPFSLCPVESRSIELISGLYDELLPHFSSPLLNVGCDETFDLGQGRSKEIVESKGSTRVYLDFLLNLYRLAQSHDRKIMFWGDIILHEPQLVAELPKDIIALLWGYDADHTFDRDGEVLAKSGIPFYVCPGTSSWCTLLGRTDNCLKNLANAAENGKKHGAIGFLNTDWGDQGHPQYLPSSYLGFAAGAAYSWGLEANRDPQITRALDIHAFHDSAGVMGKLAYDLGNVCKKHGLDGYYTTLFKLLIDQKENIVPADLSMESLEGAIESIDEIMTALSRSKMDHPESALIRREFENGAAMGRHAARRGRWLLDRTAENVVDLKEDLRQIIGRHEELWLSRNRPGGLFDSSNRLRTTLNTYELG